MMGMTTPNRFSFARVGHADLALESRVTDLRVHLGTIPPERLADWTGAARLELGPERGEFHLAMLGQQLVVTYPDFRVLTVTGDSVSVIKQALLIYYFVTSTGASPSEQQWISFADLPEGRVYSSAFQGYTGDELTKRFRLDLDAFRSACQRAGGTMLSLGNAAYRFSAFPRLGLAVVYHLGDEDFPSMCKILFAATAGQYLPTEACAMLGSMLTQKILRAVV